MLTEFVYAAAVGIGGWLIATAFDAVCRWRYNRGTEIEDHD